MASLWKEGEWIALSEDVEYGGQGMPKMLSSSVNEMFAGAKSGIQHNMSLGTNMKAMKYFTVSPNANYKEVWYFDRLKKKFDDVENAVVTDTISSFNAFREYSTGV